MTCSMIYQWRLTCWEYCNTYTRESCRFVDDPVGTCAVS